MLFTLGLIALAGFGVHYWLTKRAAGSEDGAKLFGFPARTVIGLAGLVGTFFLPGILGMAALGVAAGSALPPLVAKLTGKSPEQITTTDAALEPGESSFMDDLATAYNDIKNSVFQPAQA